MHFEWIEFSATRTMLVAVWCLLELYFWYHANSTKRRLQQQRKPARLLSRAERQTLYWNCFHTVHEPRKWFAGWFYMIDSPCRESPDFSEIYRENIATWFAWAFWVDHLEMVRSNARWAAELEWMISNAEHRYGVRFPRGHNPKIRCIRPSLDPVESIHRPLLFYAFNYCLTWLFNVVFLRWFWHFEYHGTSTPSAAWGGIFATLHRWERALWPCSNGIDTASSYQHLTFWYRKQGQKKTPIVFVHGIGMGLLFYADLIHRLVKLDRPVFLIEIPYVSMRLVEHVPTPEETASEIDNMLTSQGYNQAIFVAHSFGTAVASWLATFAPKLMGGLVMVDPICFLLNYHHVAFNMLHRVPKKAMEYFIHYFASRELFINHYISRHFQWYRTIFIVYPTPSEEPPKLPTNQVEPSSPLSNATVFLSEKDIIVDSTVINDYLKERGVDVRLMRNLRHGGFLIDRKWRQQVLDQTEQLARNIEGEGIVNKA